VVGDLTIAMAETAQFQRLSHPSHRWVAPPVARAPSTTLLQKEATFYRFKREQRMGEGSLHPRPEGRGIRDPPHSRCNKNSIYASEKIVVSVRSSSVRSATLWFSSVTPGLIIQLRLLTAEPTVCIRGLCPHPLHDLGYPGYFPLAGPDFGRDALESRHAGVA